MGAWDYFQYLYCNRFFQRALKLTATIFPCVLSDHRLSSATRDISPENVTENGDFRSGKGNVCKILTTLPGMYCGRIPGIRKLRIGSLFSFRAPAQTGFSCECRVRKLKSAKSVKNCSLTCRLLRLTSQKPIHSSCAE